MKTAIPSARTLRHTLCLVLAVVMAVSPSASVFAQTNAAQQAIRQRVEGGLGQGEEPEASRDGVPAPRPARRTPAVQPAAGAIDTTYVAPSAAMVVVLRPSQLLKSPITEMLPTEVATAAGLKYFGFDPADVDEVVAFGDLSNMGAPSYGLTLKFSQPFKASSIPQERRAHAQMGELNGQRYLQSQHPMLPSFYGPNNKTLVVAPDAALRQMIEAQGQAVPGPLLDRIRQAPAGSDLYVALDIAALRPMVGMYLGMAAPQAPPDLRPLFDLPTLIAEVELTLNIAGPGPTSLVAHANDEAAAEQVLSLINDASKKYQENLKVQLAEEAASEDPVERAFAQYADRISGKWMTPFVPTRDGTSLTFFRSEGLDQNQRKMLVAALGVGAALLLPARQAARQAAQRNQSINNMRQIAIAFQNYHDTRGTFPAHANYSDDGKPLLSWRVHLLPFMEGMELHQQFRMDEPWDSEHNKALIAQMPDTYKCPGAEIEPGKTNYLAVVGKDFVMNGTKDGTKIQQITDGTSPTIMFVEADPKRAVVWTKPEDWEMNAENPHDGLGNVWPNGWNAGFVDAHIEFISDTLDVNILKALFTRAGGERVQFPLQAPAPAQPAALAPVQEVPVEDAGNR